MKIAGINTNFNVYNNQNNLKHRYTNSLSASKQNNSQNLSFGNLAEIPLMILKLYGVLAGSLCCFMGLMYSASKLGDWSDKKELEKFEKLQQEQKNTTADK